MLPLDSNALLHSHCGLSMSQCGCFKRILFRAHIAVASALLLLRKVGA